MPQEETKDERSATGLRLGLFGLALAVAVAAGVALVLRFVDAERERDLGAWRSRLDVVADSRATAVDDWLDQQFDVLSGLAENASVQLYLTELDLGGGDRGRVTAETAQAEYLRNLLIVTADQAGFTGRSKGPAVRANVARVGVAGIALLDAEGRGLVATPGMPALAGRIAEFVAEAPRGGGSPRGPETAWGPGGGRALMDLFPGPAGTPSLGFLVPVFAVQGDRGPGQRVGMVFAVKEVAGELYALLRQPGSVAETAETLLVRRAGGTVEYLSPLMDGTPALKRRRAAAADALAAAYAARVPGGFALRRDYRGAEVLVTGRAFPEAPWTLVHKIDRAEALAESDARLRRLLALLLLAVGLVAAGLMAAWWWGSSRRAAEAASRYRDLARRYESQGAFLRLVTDSQPNVIFISDSGGRYRFANVEAARRAGMAPADMIGKPLAAVLGPAAARRYEDLNRQALAAGERLSDVHRVDDGDGPRVLVSEHVPLEATAEWLEGVLVVERDVSAAVVERERRERILANLVRTLITVVDRRDPFAANHSVCVGTVARALAEEMGLGAIEVETAEIAGSLMNLGKILVPEEVLTKAGALSEDEMRRVHGGIQASAELLEGIDFDGPVVETIRQLNERWDGGGPRGLAGEAILVTARIVAVANAFVALVSPRAYRAGRDFDGAVDTLLAEANTVFDRRVVATLIGCLDNRGARERWTELFARRALA